MAQTTSIEWTDGSWNPVTGCTKVSPGCDNCYADTFAERFRGTPGHYFENGFDLQLRPNMLRVVLGWKKPRKIFVNSMSDLFHQDIPDEYIADVFAVMATAERHTFQLLTKRHSRMRALLRNPEFAEAVQSRAAGHGLDADAWQWPLPNLVLGVSVEDQKHAELRIPALLETPAAVRFLSCEPLLGAVDLRNLKARNGALIDCLAGNVKTPDGEIYAACPGSIGWVIVGGESGPGARPMDAQWARDLRDQCTATAVPFLFKQWGEHAPDGRRVTKKHAGRELDGRTWDEFPDAA